MLSKALTTAAAGSSAPTDENFNQTVLLLHGDGTNGAQNNTFLDSSTNNFTITRNGNTTQGTFSPFSLPNGRWSNYANSSTSYLKIADSTAFDLPNDFTVEFWFYPTTLSNNPYIMTLGQSTSGDGFLIYYSNATASLRFYSNGSAVLIGPSLSNNQWYHIAIVRSGGGSNNLTMYVNGVSQVTATNTTSYTGIAGNGACIGAEYSGTFGGNWWHYLSNLRLVKGTAVYTGAFTPPTAPLTAISGTSLLTCQSNRFVDNSSNAHSITVTGTPSVQPFSPFLPTAAYSASVNGGSGYFDGSGDYLTVPDDVDFDLPADFTFEFWTYNPNSSDKSYFQLGDYRAAQNGLICYTSTNNLALYGNGGSILVGSALPVNAWTHIAVVRSGGGSNNLKIYVNGVQDGQATNTTSFTGVAGNGLAIGAQYGGSYASITTATYISNFRLVKGTAIYTSAFTPPTSPVTAISGTSLLTNFTNAGIFDNTGKNNLETVGNAQIDTTTKKYGTGSLEFDGTGDWLKIPESPNLNLGTTNLTIECWLYITAAIQDYRMILSDGSGDNYLSLRGGGTGGRVELYVNANTFLFDLNNSISQNTWHHFAVVRSGTTFTVYVDGSSLGTNTSSDVWNIGNSGTFIGRWGGATAFEWPGFIDDLRITKGIARYTTTFTPPTAAFPNL